MYASYKNHPGCVKVLLEYGTDLTAQNEDNFTAMDLAVGQGHKTGTLKFSHYQKKFTLTWKGQIVMIS